MLAPRSFFFVITLSSPLKWQMELRKIFARHVVQFNVCLRIYCMISFDMPTNQIVGEGQKMPKPHHTTKRTLLLSQHPNFAQCITLNYIESPQAYLVYSFFLLFVSDTVTPNSIHNEPILFSHSKCYLFFVVVWTSCSVIWWT